MKVGENTVETYRQTNECGSDVLDLKFIRTACIAPTIGLESASVPNKGQTYSANLNLVIDVSAVSSRNEIQVNANGKLTAFNFNAATHKIYS